MNMTNIFEGASFPPHRFSEMTKSHLLCHIIGEISSVTALQGVVNICIWRMKGGENWSLLWIYFILACKAERLRIYHLICGYLYKKMNMFFHFNVCSCLPLVILWRYERTEGNSLTVVEEAA